MNYSIEFWDYVFDNIASRDFPASATLLTGLKSRLDSSDAFYEMILDMDTDKAQQRTGCGRVAAKHVNRLCDMMRRIDAYNGTSKIFTDLDDAEPATLGDRIDCIMKGENDRIYHAYKHFWKHTCKASVRNFYLTVVGSDIEDIKYDCICQVKSRSLLETFRGLLPQIDDFMSGAYPVAGAFDCVFTLKTIESGHMDGSLCLTEDHRTFIASFCAEYGHFPLFAAVKYKIDSMESRKREIIRLGVRTVRGQEVMHLKSIGERLNGISFERVRQLRHKILESIGNYVSHIVQAGLLEDYRYNLSSAEDFDRIRREECVDFSDEFMVVVLYYACQDLAVVGDYDKALFSQSPSKRKLFLVSARLDALFDFEAFIDEVERRRVEKRSEPYTDSLENFVSLQIGKTDAADSGSEPVSDTEFAEIVDECERLLRYAYPENIQDGHRIYFGVKVLKNLPVLIEDIIRMNNAPMTAEQISEVMRTRYGLEKNVRTIGPNALHNSNILPISRTSTYTLAEWSEQVVDENGGVNRNLRRGGTIRDIVREYLGTLTPSIASISDICREVGKYRARVIESSIQCNLALEPSFCQYRKADSKEMYIGLVGQECDEQYALMQECKNRSFKESAKLLEDFIRDNKRFPGYDGGNEEARLNRFLNVCRNKMSRGTMDDDRRAVIHRIETEYGHYKSARKR